MTAPRIAHRVVALLPCVIRLLVGAVPNVIEEIDMLWVPTELGACPRSSDTAVDRKPHVHPRRSPKLHCLFVGEAAGRATGDLPDSFGDCPEIHLAGDHMIDASRA